MKNIYTGLGVFSTCINFNVWCTGTNPPLYCVYNVLLCFVYAVCIVCAMCVVCWMYITFVHGEVGTLHHLSAVVMCLARFCVVVHVKT